MSEAHIAGIEIDWDGRYLRQRCAWCGKVMIDYDLARIAVQIPEDGSEPDRPGTWPAGAIIRTDGAMSAVVIESGEVAKLSEVAPDACVFLDPAVTR